MKYTNNHNKYVLKKTCVGVLVCTENCGLQDGRKVRIRPAISDKGDPRLLIFCILDAASIVNFVTSTVNLLYTVVVRAKFSSFTTEMRIAKVLGRELSSRATKHNHVELNIIGASNRHRIDEKKWDMDSRAAFNNILASICGVFSRGSRLFKRKPDTAIHWKANFSTFLKTDKDLWNCDLAYTNMN